MNEIPAETLSREGRVLRVEPPLVWLAVERQAMCGQCQLKHSCMDAAEACKEVHVHAAIPQNMSLEPGDRVRLRYGEGRFLLNVFMAYLLPALGMVAGALLGHTKDWLGSADLTAAAFALAGLAVGIIILVIYEKTNKKKRCFSMEIEKII